MEQEQKIHLSIIIPAYDEEKRIKDTIMDVSGYLKKQDYASEIIVVNDGSKDRTSEIVNGLTDTVDGLILENKENGGKGSAVKQGMLKAKGQYRLFMDADNAISITHLDGFWPHIKKNGNHDLVIGSIELEGSRKEEKYVGFSKIYRNVFGKLSKYLVRVLAVWEIYDTQRAFKLFTAEAVEKIFPRQTIMHWGFDIEILVIAKKQGYKIKELPVEWVNPPGKVTFAAYIKTLRELFQIKWNSLVGKYK